MHVSQYKSISNFCDEQLVHQFWVSLIMFNNINKPNEIVVIDSVNHFNQDDICQLSVKP